MTGDCEELYALVSEYRAVLKRLAFTGSTHDLVDAHRIAGEIDLLLSTTDCGPRTAPTIRRMVAHADYIESP